jgi:Asp-tRNA(Asn)/Glu-tRNA(Gln) amidotransferase A subunit family amidase
VTGSRSVGAALEGIDAWQERTNAFAQVFADEARAAAADVGTDGRLAGLPIAVKDLIDVRGHPTTGCCAAIASEPAERDAALVTRLRDEGAIVIGKTNQHELAAGVTNLESSYGPTRNPWDLLRITGGSSGGSAVAVATGIVPISLVSDTGGSARIPAAFCGTWGLKPTQGRLPTEGMMSLAPAMDCPGVLAGSLDDLRLGWEVLADPPIDRAAPSVVGLLRGGRWERCALEIKAAVGQAAERFRDTGAEVRDVDGSALDDVHRVWNRLAWPPFAERYGGLTGNPSLGGGVASLLEWGSAHRDELPDARSRGERIRGWFDDALDRVDLFLAATTPYVAPPIDAEEVDLGDGTTIDVHRGGPSWHTTAANVAGLPALSVPFATSIEGLPIGVQLIGPPNREDVLFAAAEGLRPAVELPTPSDPRR